MSEEFENMKRVLKNLGTLQIADYDKKLFLRTNASKIDMSSVLLQKSEG